jgi:hypothetical protein
MSRDVLFCGLSSRNLLSLQSQLGIYLASIAVPLTSLATWPEVERRVLGLIRVWCGIVTID